jgi:hypothetical protein
MFQPIAKRGNDSIQIDAPKTPPRDLGKRKLADRKYSI